MTPTHDKYFTKLQDEITYSCSDIFDGIERLTKVYTENLDKLSSEEQQALKLDIKKAFDTMKLIVNNIVI
jgi:hypothetical protein